MRWIALPGRVPTAASAQASPAMNCIAGTPRQAFRFPRLPGPPAAAAAGGFPSGRPDPGRNIERILDVELEVVVRFGLTQMPLKELVRVGVGSMIELNRQVDEPVEVLVNDRVLARGSVVVVDGYYGVCISEIGLPEERRLSLARNI